MPAVAMCSMKGGTGKTTIAFNLAERAFAGGLRVLHLDFDPQEGSIGIADLREKSGLFCWPIASSRVSVSHADRLAFLKEEDPERLLVCDLPGADSMALVRLLSEMDLILSPVGSGLPDLLAAANFSSSVGGMNLNLPLVFLPNNVTHLRRRREDLLDELSVLEVDVCPVLVQHRVAHLDCLRSGLGVCEAFPRSPAAGEIDALWEWVCCRLGIRPESISHGSFPDDSTESEVAYSFQG